MGLLGGNLLGGSLIRSILPVDRWRFGEVGAGLCGLLIGLDCVDGGGFVALLRLGSRLAAGPMFREVVSVEATVEGRPDPVPSSSLTEGVQSRNGRYEGTPLVR